jgi:hypothetical protein
MPSQITITAPIGPGKGPTATVLTDVTALEFLFNPKSTLKVKHGKGKTSDFDISASDTWTATIAAGVGTVTVSQ